MTFATKILVSLLFFMVDIGTHILGTVPDDYDDLLAYYTKRGYRVIAMAGKSIEGLTWLKAQKMKR